jgi:hypothetical protein
MFEVPCTAEVVETSRSEVLARYLALFRAPLDKLTAGKIVGESTPSYLFYGEPVGSILNAEGTLAIRYRRDVSLSLIRVAFVCP